MYTLTGKAAIISDIHLGSVVCLHHQLNNFLDTVHAGEYALLVIVGDLLESTQYNRLESRDWKVLSKLRKMSNDVDVIYVNGNHDAYHPEVVASLLGLRFVGESFKILTKTRSVVCIHGHQFDVSVSQHPWATFILGWLYLAVQKFDRRHRIAKTVKRWTKWIIRCSPRVKTGALNMFKRDFVVCGHTHKAEFNGDGYLNLGSWVELRGSYAEIDEEGNVILHTWQPRLE